MDVLPRARLIVGATGRVDLVSGRAHALLVRFGQDEWAFMRLAENGGEWERRDLTADSLSDVLLGLLR